MNTNHELNIILSNEDNKLKTSGFHTSEFVFPSVLT